jgi:hypothetical protein
MATMPSTGKKPLEAADVVGATHKRKFQIFRVAQAPTRTVLYGFMTWDGDEVDEFLDFAEKAGAAIMYVRQEKLDASEYEPDPLLSEHDGQIGLVELCFLREGVFHRFSWEADWAEGLFGEAEQDELPSQEPEGAASGPEAASIHQLGLSTLTSDEGRKLGDALEARAHDLVTGFVEAAFTKDGVAPAPDNEWEVRNALLAYLADYLAIPRLSPRSQAPGFYSTIDLTPALEKGVKAAAASASREIRAREKAILDPLVQPCVEWALAEEIPLRSLNFARLQEFLQSKAVSVSSSGVRDLRDRVSAAIKRRRGTQSHHAPV